MLDHSIEINYNDLDNLRDIMDDYGDVPHMLDAISNDGEEQNISIGKDCIIVTTFQNNGWARVNTYYYDGTVEEYYDGRWK